MTDLEKFRYPVGRFQRLTAPLDLSARSACLDIVERAPEQFRALLKGRSERELDTPYRPGGWTVRQVVHHVPDSHLNAYIRMKWALTEETPPVKTYDETRWAELHEAKSAPAEIVAGAARSATSPMGTLHARPVRRGLRARGDAPGMGTHRGRRTARAVLLALPASRGAHQDRTQDRVKTKEFRRVQKSSDESDESCTLPHSPALSGLP